MYDDDAMYDGANGRYSTYGCGRRCDRGRRVYVGFRRRTRGRAHERMDGTGRDARMNGCVSRRRVRTGVPARGFARRRTRAR